MNWLHTFYNSVGTYVRIINLALEKEFRFEPLSNHIKITGGYAFKSSEYRKVGVPIVRISDFNNEQVDLSEAVYYDESPALDRFSLIAGDVLIALTGGTIGKLGIVQDGLGKMYLNQRVGRFDILNKAEFLPEYVYWIARSVQDIVKNLAWGGAQPNVSPKQIEALQFPFPDKKRQQGIVDFLNDLKDNSVNESKEYFSKDIEIEIVQLQSHQVRLGFTLNELDTQLTYLTQLRQALLREAMQGQLLPQDPTDEPAAVLLQKLQAEKAATGKGRKGKEGALFAEEAEVVEGPFEIPESWVWCRLNSISIITGGGTPSMGNPNYWDGNILWVTPKDMYSEVIVDSEMKISNLAIQNSSANLVPEGSLLIVGRSGILKRRVPVSIAGQELTVNQDMKVVVPAEKGMSRYLQLMFYGLEKIILKEYVKYGMTVHSLRYQEFAEMPIPLPPLAEQHRIVAKLEQLMQHCDALEQQVRESRRLAEQLLQTALREALAPPAVAEGLAEEAEAEVALAEAAEAPAAPRRGRGRPPKRKFERGDQMSFDDISFD